jgi:hypothetical protein
MHTHTPFSKAYNKHVASEKNRGSFKPPACAHIKKKDKETKIKLMLRP